MSYQRERDEFIDRMTREGLPLQVTVQLLRAATTLQRYAELSCSSEAADRDRVPCPAAARTHTVTIKGRAVYFAGRARAEAYAEGYRQTSGGVILGIDAYEDPKRPCLCDDYPTGSHARGEHSRVPRHRVREARLEARIAALLEAANRDLARRPSGMVAEGGPGWIMDTQGDPRGYVLRVIPPSYAERNQGRDRHNREAVGVPARDTGLRF